MKSLANEWASQGATPAVMCRMHRTEMNTVPMANVACSCQIKARILAGRRD